MRKISVVIPAYNCAPYLANTVSAVCAQSCAQVSVEIIVVDDGSTDATAELASGLPVTLIQQKNAGVSAARNVGVLHASGDFVCFLDADDLIEPGWFARASAIFEQRPEIGVVYGNFRFWPAAADASPEDEWRLISAQQAAAGERTDEKNSGWMYHRMLLNSWVLCSSAIVRRPLVAQAGGFEEGVPAGEDWAFWMRVSRLAPMFKFMRAVVLYRQHPTQASRKVRKINYPVLLIEDALARYGLCGPGGCAANMADVNVELAKHHRWHGVAHLRNGVYLTGVKSLVRALILQPSNLADWRLLFLSVLGLGRAFFWLRDRLKGAV